MSVPTALGISVADVASYLYGDGSISYVDPACPIKRGEGTADAAALNSGPDWMVLISRSVNGPYVTEERALQTATFQVRTVGKQADYDSAETLAFQIHRLLLAPGSALQMGAVRVSSVDVTDGGPTLLVRDASQRTHFTASYALVVPSGLA